MSTLQFIPAFSYITPDFSLSIDPIERVTFAEAQAVAVRYGLRVVGIQIGQARALEGRLEALERGEGPQGEAGVRGIVVEDVKP